MGDFFRNQSIGFKVLGGILLVIGISAGSSLFGLFSIGKIGVGLEVVARDNMPLLNQMSDINQQQLEQSVVFERGMQLALIISSADDGYQRVTTLKNRYAEAGQAIGKAIKEFVAIAEKAGSDNSGHRRDEFLEYAKTMKAIHSEYEASQQQNGEIFDYVLQGRIDDAAPMVQRAQAGSEALRGKLVDMQKQLISRASAAAAEARDQETTAYATMSILLAFGVIAGLVLSVMISRGITVPLCQTLRALEDIAEGDGDLTQRLRVEGKDELAQLGNAFNRFVDKIHHVLINVSDAAEYIVEGSQGISNRNENLLARTDEQRSRLIETSSSMEEMTNTVKRNAESAREASKLAEANQERAMAGAEVVMNAVDAVTAINASSDKIADIIGTIDGIAFQTNLLALNAAVEAARAGEQGRGFAVVATEVRSLAQRSAEAAKEIKALIVDSLSKVRTGTQLVDQSGMALEEIIVGTKRVADLIADIAEISQEQASGIDMVNSSIVRMNQMTDENASMVRESAAASHTMRDQVDGLIQRISFFKLTQDAPSLEDPDSPPPALIR